MKKLLFVILLFITSTIPATANAPKLQAEAHVHAGIVIIEEEAFGSLGGVL